MSDIKEKQTIREQLTEQRDLSTFLRVFYYFLLPITLLVDLLFLWSIALQLHSYFLPTVPGKIVSSSVEVDNSGDGGLSYTPALRYEYSVSGVPYSGSRFQYVWSGVTQDEAEEIVASHPLGTTVQVHYNPADPGDSVLKVGLQKWDMFRFWIILPFNIPIAIVLCFSKHVDREIKHTLARLKRRVRRRPLKKEV